VAALVHHINQNLSKHVVSLENPIEFLHRDLTCSITQRDVGVDTESLTIGVRAALRQDPDVVVLGEIADAETIDTAIKGAETGRLVIASMPTPDVITTIERILTTLPREEREIGRMRLSEALRAIISQQLLPLKDDKGRVPAVEVLVATPLVRECLKDAKRTGELRDHMADGRKQLGTQTFDQHVGELIEAGLITADTGRAALSLGAGPAPAPAKKGPKQAASA